MLISVCSAVAYFSLENSWRLWGTWVWFKFGEVRTLIGMWYQSLPPKIAISLKVTNLCSPEINCNSESTPDPTLRLVTLVCRHAGTGQLTYPQSSIATVCKYCGAFAVDLLEVFREKTQMFYNQVCGCCCLVFYFLQWSLLLLNIKLWKWWWCLL